MEAWRAGRAHSAALGRRQVAVDRHGRGQMGRLAAHRGAGTGRCRPAARLCGGGEAARLHRRRSAGDGRVEPRARKCWAKLSDGSPAGRASTCWTAPIPRRSRRSSSAVDLGKTLFIVSSKSGSTLEPNIFMDYFLDRVGAVRGKDKAGEHFVAVTDPGSSLEQRAEAAWLRPYLPRRALDRRALLRAVEVRPGAGGGDGHRRQTPA